MSSKKNRVIQGHRVIEGFYCFFNFFYREAETVDPRSGHPVPQGDSSKSFARFWG